MNNKKKAESMEDTPVKHGMSLRSKLLLMLIAAGLAAVVTIAWLGYRHSENQLTKTAFEQLTSLRSSKTQQIEGYFENLRNVIRLLGEAPEVSKSLLLMSTSFANLDNKPMDQDVLSDAQQEKLAQFYKSEYFPRLDQLRDGKSNVEIFWPRSRAGQRAQSHYIAESPYGIGKKLLLNSSSAHSSYDMIHKQYHDYYRKTRKSQNLYDIFLIDGHSGDIVYSVAKETDFGTNLLNGPYAHSSLGKLFRKIRARHAPGLVLMEDFEEFPPSYNAPAAFVGTPIYTSGGLFIGVLAAQFSPDKINRIMTNDYGWKKSGLGESGEMYIVADDLFMRSNSRFLLEDRGNYFKSLVATHTPKPIIEKIKKFDTSVIFQRVSTDGVRAAFNGKTEEKIIEDYRGVRVLSSYAPLDIPDLHWVMLAEIDEAEVRQPQNRFARNVLLSSGILLLLTTLASLLIASKFLQPISVLIDGVARIRKGEKNVKIDKLANDEFGELSDTFNVMTREIEKRDEIIEQQSGSYDDFLNQLYPANIVERLQAGESKIANAMHQVSVVYMIIHGFSKETESMDSADALDLLNELVTSLDSTCETYGVEKVKTIGEHHLAVCGLSVPRLDHARRALDFSHAASREVAIFNSRYDMSLALRVGIHSGPLKSGIVGGESFDFDVWGNSLNIARRIVFEADLSKVRLTTHTYHMLNTSEDYGPQLIVDTRVIGEVSTYELDLDTAVDENRVDRRPRKKTDDKKGKPKQTSPLEGRSDPAGDDATNDSSKAAE